MRKRQKGQIIELLNTMMDGSEELLTITSQQEQLTMLEDCQQAAIQIGESIEASEGEGTQAVTCLEKYCEILFQLSEEINGATGQTDIHDYVTEMKKLMQTAAEAVDSFENTIEMVFFPYKASMWDSLESIWIAASEDPRVHAVVVPIPYVDRNPDGSVKEEHYEINLYPKEVPVVDYHDYNLDEEKPDVAFIHNPYDGDNLVTSVHPHYYSYNLKPKVGKLVYVPYFALPGNLDNNYSDFSAYHHVDYIVTQTKEHRKSFPANLPDEMFLPFGSPKFDAIIRKCKNPKPIPEAWKSKMEGKRVFFYNTSIRCAINEPEHYLKKMGEVFKTFAGREDVCLVWRPHPLLEATFDSMLPEYASVFRRLRELYIQQKIGIYDDTPCMEDTISWCNAYLGDMGSSVVSSFAMAGKPIYILNNQMHGKPGENDWKSEVYRLIFDLWGDDRWIVTWQDELWHSPKNDYHYEFVCKLVDDYNSEHRSYYLQAKEYKNKVYIFPANTQNVLVYEQGKIRKIELDKEGSGYGAFVGGNIYGNHIYLWPMEYSSVIKINVETEEVIYDRELRDFYIKKNGETILRGGCAYAGACFAFASPNKNEFILETIDTFEKKRYSLPLTNWKGTSTIIPELYAFENEDRGYYWLLPREGYEIYRVKLETGEIRKYTVKSDGFQNTSDLDETYETMPQFCGVFSHEAGKVIICPWYGTHYIELDLQTGKSGIWNYSIKHDFAKNKRRNNVPGSNVESYREEMKHGVIRFANGDANCMIEVDIKNNTTTEIQAQFDNEFIENQYAGFQSKDYLYCCNENLFNGLDKLILDNIRGKRFNRIIQSQKNQEINASINGECGKKTLDYLLNNYS